MKKLMLACVIILLSVSVASAEWIIDFRDTYAAEGIDKAVENALKDGNNPDAIVELGVQLEGLNPQNLIRALYCAGANGQDIRAAAEKWQISELIIVAGYNKAAEECGERVADAQAYTPVESGPSFITPSGGRTGSFGSPNTF